MRFFIPKSRTYWIGMIMLVSGVLMIIDAIWSLGLLGLALNAAYGDTSPFMLILAGSGTITMRAAIK